MKKAFFVLGLVALFLSALLWVSSSSTGIYQMNAGEFFALVAISLIMMAPEIIYQMRRFLDSGSEHVPF